MNWNVIPTFANPITSTFIDPEICNKLSDLVSNQDWIEDSEEAGTLGATTFDKHLLDSQTEIGGYVKQKCIDYVIDVLNYQIDIQLVSSWLTRTYKGGSCQQHSHYNSWYSGIIYFGEYDNDSAPIEFYDPVYKSIFPEPFNYNYYNSRSWRMDPKTNMMIIFPSHLQHKVLTHRSEILRYSLAFNIMPKGTVGHDDSVFEY
jgi:uncharacterized protein (TIGR02466 family)|tara:strand:+ start:794 stop:1399 length:606 start_codon:yes stop_codon:yes gene_type:complete